MDSSSSSSSSSPYLDYMIGNGNGSAHPSTSFLSSRGILEIFLPGYSLISHYLLLIFGFDITLLVSAALLLFAIVRASLFLYQNLFNLLAIFCMSSISIDSDDDVHDAVLAWMCEQPAVTQSRFLQAHRSPDNNNNNNKDNDQSSYERQMHVSFEPARGSYTLFHEYRYIFITRELIPQAFGTEGNTSPKPQERLRITCLGRSTEPIKSLIRVCTLHYATRLATSTTIRRPAPIELRSKGRYPWIKVSTRPSRSPDTVVLEDKEKLALFADVKDYLSANTARWYADRGIPYRRGYLFHGPPGTGKTSMSFALAGHFGLDIYCISLLEPSLTEDGLMTLFSALPSRCVVLLEDIDSAGLGKRNLQQEDSDLIVDLDETGEEMKNQHFTLPSDSRSNISLSGMLNVIDGVSSHEGRLLILTSNYPENLDQALMRPGRIDRKVYFPLSTPEQTRKLFLRMYEPVASENGGIDGGKVPPTKEDEKLNLMAIDFANILSDKRLSPAQIQGFLMTHRDSPAEALQEVRKVLLGDSGRTGVPEVLRR